MKVNTLYVAYEMKRLIMHCSACNVLHSARQWRLSYVSGILNLSEIEQVVVDKADIPFGCSFYISLFFT